MFQLPPADGRLGKILDPAANPGFAVGPFRPVSGKGNPSIDDKISVSGSSDIVIICSYFFFGSVFLFVKLGRILGKCHDSDDTNRIRKNCK